jgi:intein-encoded DNA endonuclease-like protein
LRCKEEEIATTIVNINEINKGELSYRDFVGALADEGISLSYTTIRNYCMLLGGEQMTDYIKPSLTKKNEVRRLLFILKQIDRTDVLNLVYFDQYDVVHIDEKWVFLQELKKNDYNS